MTSSFGNSQDHFLVASLASRRRQGCLPLPWRAYVKLRLENFNLSLICIQFQQKRVAGNGGSLSAAFWGADINFHLKLKGLSALMEGSGECVLCSLSLCTPGMYPTLEKGHCAGDFSLKQIAGEARAARGGGL